jgi:hypothetical protein
MKNLLQIIAVSLITATGFSQTARVQVIHNSADAAASVVDVYVDAANALDDFAFRTASPFVDLPAGVQIDLSIAPGNSTSVADAILTVPVTLAENETYIVVADGIVSGSGYNPAPPLGLQVYALGREMASNPANVDVLVHHGATDAPTVDVVEVGAGAGTVVDDIAYTEFQGYLELPSADYAIEVQDATGTVTVAAYELPLAGLGLTGEAVVAVASGFLDPSQNSGGPAFGIWAALAAGGPLVELPASTARVQVIHNSADAAAQAVDVYIGGALALDDFEFRTATPFIDFPAGTVVEIAVAPPTSTGVGDAIATFPVTLARQETYIVVADGIVSPTGYNPPQPFGLEVYPLGRETATLSTNTDILVHHGSTDAPTVDIVETGVGAGIIVNNISYPEFQGYLELPTADYVIQVNNEDNTAGVAAYSAPLSTLALDGVALVAVASGFLDPSQNSNGPAFGLWVALPSGGAMIELPSATLGIEEFDTSSFVMYPNPVVNTLNVSIDSANSEEFTIMITDMTGRRIVERSLSSTNDSIDVSALVPGIYNFSIIKDLQFVQTKRFIKQ